VPIQESTLPQSGLFRTSGMPPSTSKRGSPDASSEELSK
jgi:hypothetical protein